MLHPYYGKVIEEAAYCSALMALENWLIAFVEKSNQISAVESLFDYLLRNSNSVMITSVLASVAVGFPEKIGNAGYPLLTSPLLYGLDLDRTIQEQGGSYNWFFRDIQRGYLIAKLYAEERKTANLRPWRKQYLESLLLHYQADANYRQGAFAIIDRLAEIAEGNTNQNLIFMLNRLDIRKLTPVEDKENNRILLVNQNELPDELKSIQQEL